MGFTHKNQCRGNFKPCFGSPSQASLEINFIKGLQ